MSLTRKVAYNTAAQIFGRAANTVLAIVTVGVLTRYLGVAGFGEYTTVFAFVSLFSTLADFGFMIILLRELGAGKVSPEKATRNVLSIRTIFAVAVYLIAFIIGLFLGYPWVVQLGIGVIGLSMLWGTIQGTVIAVLQANLRVDKAVIGDAVARAIILGLVAWWAHQGSGLLLVLCAYPIGTFVGFAINSYYANKYVKLGFACDFKYWKYLWAQSWPVGLAGILAMVYFKIDSVMLSLMKTETDIGIYGAPYKIFEVLLALSALFVGVAFPIMSRYFASHDMERLRGALQKSVDFLVLLALPLVVASIILAEPIIRIIAGQAFVVTSTFTLFGQPMTAVLTLQILAVTILLSYLTNIFNNMIVVCGKQRSLILPNFIFLAINVGLNLVLIPRYSYIGAAVATVITEICVLSVNWHLLHKFVNFRLAGAAALKGFLAVVAMGIVMYLMRGLFIVWPVVFGTAIYIVIVLLSKAVSKEMVVEIIRGKAI